MLNITSEISINATKKSHIINNDIRINDETWNKIVRNTIESSNADD